MDYNWTQPQMRPRFLYRVCHPQARTIYLPTVGHVSPLLYANSLSKTQPSLPTYTAHDPTSLRFFLKSIRQHCSQNPKPSPWVSTFASKTEAEMWCLAAEDMDGTECIVMVIDTEAPAMKDSFWFQVQDVVAKFRQQMDMADVGSECLTLGHIPVRAILGKEKWLYARNIRKKYGCQPRQYGLSQMLSDPNEDMKLIPKYDNTLFESPQWKITYKPEGMDDCDCRHVDVCMHFDWDFGTEEQETVKPQGGLHVHQENTTSQ